MRVVSLGALCLLYTSSVALANGRFPKAQMFVRGKSENEVIVRTTFGLVNIQLTPRKLNWVCEEALGFSGTWDPPLARDTKGRLWVGLEHGVRVMPEGALCKGEGTTRIPEESIGDLAETARGIIGVTSTRGRAPRLFRQSAGATGPDVELLASGPMGMRFETLEAAPSRPDWIYVTGADYDKKPLAHLYRSRDGGKTLADVPLTLVSDGPLFLSAIDPGNPERLYVRQITETGGTKILVSNDGGSTFKEALSVSVPLLGLARSADGKVLLAAAADEKTGVLRSEDRGEHWKSVAHVGAQCLFATASGFFACGNPLVRGADAVLFSKNRGDSFERFATFAEVQGPDACNSVCAASWEQMRRRLDPSAPQVPDVEDDVPDAGAGPSAGATAPATHGGPAIPPDAKRTVCGVGSTGANLGVPLALLMLGSRRRLRGSRKSQTGG
jgi:hypothetical protein